MIWTDHALSRMRERGISQGDAWTTWRNPDSSKHSKLRGGWVYYKTVGRKRIGVVAKKNERGEWLILSVWSKTKVVNGEERNVWKAIKRLIGL